MRLRQWARICRTSSLSLSFRKGKGLRHWCGSLVSDFYQLQAQYGVRSMFILIEDLEAPFSTLNRLPLAVIRVSICPICEIIN
jgi:hypothetical protein